MKVSIKDRIMFIELPLNESPKLSATGKTYVVATTHGNVQANVEVEGKPVIIGINAYIRR